MIQLPKLFVDRTKEILGDEYSDFAESLKKTAPVSVRVNNKICDYIPSKNKVQWCEDGFYLDERPVFTADPLLHSGAYYVQEASSMFLQQVVKSYLSNVNITLDLCAAPGGKSTLLSQYLPAHSLLVSNEYVRSRAMILAENIIKWSNHNVVVTNNSPADIGKLNSFFDAIIIDAPCSGEGMFRKDHESIKEWSVQNVQQCAIRQKSIIADVWNSLKNDGILVYSTCTYNKEENEENIQWICQHFVAEILKIDIDKFDGIVSTDYGYRFYPHKIKGEGFFISVIRKKSENDRTSYKFRKNNQIVKYADRWNEYKQYLKNSESYVIKEINKKIIAFPDIFYNECIELEKTLNCVINGVELAEIKMKDSIPSHQLALSKIFNKDNFNTIELNYETAIAYLRKESITLNDMAVKGYIAVTYKQQVLGWVKNIGNRANNLYPQHWRIRMHL